MSKKRTTPDDNSPDNQTNNEDAGPIFWQDDDTKRVKLTQPSDKTLDDLPLELVESILLRAIVLEVEEMNLAKSAWKEKADLVVQRLGTVCPYWNSILTTNFFRNELHRILERTAEKTYRLEVLHQSHLEGFNVISGVTMLKDELFILCRPKGVDASYNINVYDRHHLEEPRDVIDLPGICPSCMTACNVSNCLYILSRNFRDPLCVLRIARETDHPFTVSTLISDEIWGQVCGLSVAANGELILWKQNACHDESTYIVVYDANGSMKREMVLTTRELRRFEKLIPKSNGNIVLVSSIEDCWYSTDEEDYDDLPKMTEIDWNGTVLHQHQLSLGEYDALCVAELHGRIVNVEHPGHFELLDDEFNLLKVIGATLDDDLEVFTMYDLHYDSHRNELVTIFEDVNSSDLYLFILALTLE